MPASTSLLRTVLPVLVAAFLVLVPQAATPQSQDDEITVTGMAPNPIVGNGAPLFTASDIDQVLKQADEAARYSKSAQEALLGCSNDIRPLSEQLKAQLLPFERGETAATRLIVATKDARVATLETNELRRRVPLGQATQAELEASELKRQDAVNKMVSAKADDAAAKDYIVTTQDLQREGLDYTMWDTIASSEQTRRAKQKMRDATAPQDAGVLVENVSVRPSEDRKGAFFNITGQMRNTHQRNVEIPKLSFTAFDEQGFALLTQVAHARGKMKPGQVTPFAFQMRPALQRAKAVKVYVGGREALRFMSPPPTCFWSADSVANGIGGN